MDQISKAAQMAGEWWAERLSETNAAKREVFSASVAKHCEATMRRSVANGYGGACFLQVDYDPQKEMLDAVRESIAPECQGYLFSARGILPQKHSLLVRPLLLQPKEGYGNYRPDIVVPFAE